MTNRPFPLLPLRTCTLCTQLPGDRLFQIGNVGRGRNGGRYSLIERAGGSWAFWISRSRFRTDKS